MNKTKTHVQITVLGLLLMAKVGNAIFLNMNNIFILYKLCTYRFYCIA